jgi:hypothetical protein
VKLAVVGSTTQPRVSANDAYARMTDQPHAPALAGLESVASWFPPPIPLALTEAIEGLRLSQG